MDIPNTVDSIVRAIEKAKAQEGFKIIPQGHFSITRDDIETLSREGFVLCRWENNPPQFVAREKAQSTNYMFIKKVVTDYRVAFEYVGPNIDEQKLHQVLRERGIGLWGSIGWWQETNILSLQEAIQLYRELEPLIPELLVLSE